MTKISGLGNNLYVDGVDLSGDTSSLGQISKSLTPILMTGIDKEAVERKAGKLDAAIDMLSFFNPTNAHPEWKLLPRTDRVVSFFVRPTLAMPVASIVAKQVSYDGNREESGAFTLQVNTLANAWWLDWGKALTAGKRTDTVATNGTGVDFGDPTPAAYTFGLQAYLHVFAFTGTDVTIKLQQSSDNGVGDPFADVTGGAFTLVTGSGFGERIQTARNQTVERYLRVATTGTFSSVQFAVSATINVTEMTI